MGKRTVREPILQEIRRDEFHTVLALLERPALNTIVVLRGETGSGKTVLLTRVAKQAKRAGFTIVSPAALLSAAPVSEPRRQHPLVIVDDVDGLDESFQHRLRERMASINALEPVRLVATARAASNIDRAAHIVDLAPISADGTHTLLAARNLTASATLVRHVTDTADGNLALILQRVSECSERPLVAPELFEAACSALPHRYEYLAAEYRALQPRVQAAVLELAIIQSLPASLRHWHRNELPTASAGHLAEFLTDEATGQVRFASAVHKTAVLLAASHAQHADAHRALAAAAPDDVAKTLHEAMVDADRPGAAGAAARELTERKLPAWASALRLRAVGTAVDVERMRASARAITAAVYDGDIEFARELAHHAGEPVQAADETLVARAIGRTLAGGESDASEQAVHEALAVRGPSAPDRGNLLAALAVVCLVRADETSWLHWLHHAAASPELDRSARMFASELRKTLGICPDDDKPEYAPGPPRADTAAAVVSLFTTLTAIVRAHRHQRNGVRDVDSLIMASRQPGLAGLLAAEHRAELLAENDQWADAIAVADAVRERAARGGMRLLELRARSTIVIATALRGDVHTAKSGAHAVLSDPLARHAPQLSATATQALGLCYLSTGDAESARTVLADQLPPRGVPSNGPYAASMLDLVDARLSLDEARDAIRTPEAGPRDSGEVSSLRRQFVDRCVAALLDAESEALPQLINDSRGTQFSYERARLRLAYGRRLRAEHRNHDADMQLQAAAADFGYLGAARWQQVATQLLQSTEPATHDGTGRAMVSLTEQEHKIAALAAEGLSNKEIGDRLFLSPRTVGGHLYNIFPKLGISSRAALRDALERYCSSESAPIGSSAS